MHTLSITLQLLLTGVLALVSLLSFQLIMLALLQAFRPRPALRRANVGDDALPHVLVQLPVCNEGGLAVRVAMAAARFDWPRDRLTIQVLDDGAPENHPVLLAAINEAIPPDVSLTVLRRGERAGFKAGNLAFGLSHCAAPYVAVFDADFEPPPDFLRRTIPVMMADDGLAFVQTRWGHNNRERNWLTRVQGLLLDGHFAVEQDARFRAGLPMSFNGTAGVWSRAAIDDGGGWTGDTLTEDLDLSMRCMLRGWRTAYLPDLEVPGELPETAAAWRSQQARWTKGHAQCAKKLLPAIWRAPMPAWKKLVVTVQMGQFAFYTLAFLSAAISLTLMYMGAQYIPAVGYFGLGVSGMGLVSSMGYLYLGQYRIGRQNAALLWRALLMAVVFPSGLLLSNTRATFDAFFGASMDFKRTQRAGERYAGGWRGGPELMTGLLLPAFAFVENAWSAPFFFFAVAGLVSIGAMGWSTSLAAAATPAE